MCDVERLDLFTAVLDSEALTRTVLSILYKLQGSDAAKDLRSLEVSSVI